jgi:hypothetical protein
LPAPAMLTISTLPDVTGAGFALATASPDWALAGGGRAREEEVALRLRSYQNRIAPVTQAETNILSRMYETSRRRSIVLES